MRKEGSRDVTSSISNNSLHVYQRVHQLDAWLIYLFCMTFPGVVLQDTSPQPHDKRNKLKDTRRDNKKIKKITNLFSLER